MSTAEPRAHRPRRRWTAVLTGALLLLSLWPYLLSGLVVAGAGYVGMLGVWLLFAAVTVAVHRRWGPLSAAVPLAAVVCWFALLTAGEAWLGWSA